MGDFDEDSHQDLAVVIEKNDKVSILPGNGDGTFQVAWVCFAGDGLNSVAIGDFDGDTHLDLAVACGEVSIFINTSECRDTDGDGYEDELCGGQDCDDSDPLVNPGVVEGDATVTCDDGKDNDCDGLMDASDPDCLGPQPCSARIVPIRETPVTIWLIAGLVFTLLGRKIQRKSRELK